MLGFIVLGAVMAVTLVFALAAFLIDRGEERLEQSEPAEQIFARSSPREQRLGTGFEK